MYDVPLQGCTPEPLMGYLKALGLLRIVSDQADHAARGRWQNGYFVLSSHLDEENLLQFLLHGYEPAPIVVPWSGEDYFKVSPEPASTLYSKTPTGSAVIEAVLLTTSNRLERYRRAVRDALTALSRSGICAKGEMNQQSKPRYFAALRALASEDLLPWIDAAAMVDDAGVTFSGMLGSGGGSDGNTHFSDNYMQNLFEMLPDFDCLRSSGSRSVLQESEALLRNTLFGHFTKALVPNRTSSLFDAGAVGGANATQGMTRDPLGNPWGFILALEGTLLFAGAVSRRMLPGGKARAAFPFQVRARSTGLDSLTQPEENGRELWLPIWERPASYREIAFLLREGRADVARRSAINGVDMARAAVGLGVDRGIRAFYRISVVKGRVGGDNYNTSASLGLFSVRQQPHVDLLREIDSWLEAYRSAIGKKGPPRFYVALRGIEAAIIDYCRYGGTVRFTQILAALGRAERALAISPNFREGRANGVTRVRPLYGLSPKWVTAAHDESFDFTLALALASVREPENKIGPLRVHLEPVHPEKTNRWTIPGPTVVWKGGALSRNLLAVLERRLLEAERLGGGGFPLDSSTAAPLQAVLAFIQGFVNEQRIENLIWGLVAVRPGWVESSLPHVAPVFSIPRVYALLKLLFLPRPIAISCDERGSWRARFVDPRDAQPIRRVPQILSLLRAGRLGDACVFALRRLRADGILPMPYRRSGGCVADRAWCEAAGVDPHRLAASLLFPINERDISLLLNLVLRPADELDNRS